MKNIFIYKINDIKFLKCVNLLILPYLQLSRLDRSVGIFFVLFPYISVLIKLNNGFPKIYQIILVLFVSFIMRSIGCTVNDICDRNFDNKIERTYTRPISIKKLNLYKSWNFLFFQLLICLFIINIINLFNKFFSISIFVLTIIYPTIKRLTNFPQIFLGFIFNSGIFLLCLEFFGNLNYILLVIWFCKILWQVGYDSVYSYIDLKDDIYVGVYSISSKILDNGKFFISVLYSISIILFCIFGLLSNMNFTYHICITSIFLNFAWQIFILKLRNQNTNFIVFNSNKMISLLFLIAILFGTF